MEVVMMLIKAFVVGGAICVIGQVLIDKTKLTPAKILVMFVVVGVVLGAFGVYEKLADFGGAGATVPLTGFGFNLAKETKKAVDEQGLLGALSGPLSAASVGTMAATVISSSLPRRSEMVRFLFSISACWRAKPVTTSSCLTDMAAAMVATAV